MDDYIWASINAANGVYDPDTGFYEWLVYSGCPTKERAQEIHDALRRCAYYMFSHKQADIGMHAVIEQAKDGTYNVGFCAVNKAHTYLYMIEKHGPDKSKWPYDPRKKESK
jgi:hypothetical protein